MEKHNPKTVENYTIYYDYYISEFDVYVRLYYTGDGWDPTVESSLQFDNLEEVTHVAKNLIGHSKDKVFILYLKTTTYQKDLEIS